MSFSALDDNGAVLWSYEDVTPITSFYPYENGVIVGFVEGKIINFDKNGNVILHLTYNDYDENLFNTELQKIYSDIDKQLNPNMNNWMKSKIIFEYFVKTFTENTNNHLILRGEIVSQKNYSHEIYGEKFYIVNLEVKRLSSTSDIIPITISERLIMNFDLEIGKKVEVEGQFRSYNGYENNSNRIVSCSAWC